MQLLLVQNRHQTQENIKDLEFTLASRYLFHSFMSPTVFKMFWYLGSMDINIINYHIFLTCTTHIIIHYILFTYKLHNDEKRCIFWILFSLYFVTNFRIFFIVFLQQIGLMLYIFFNIYNIYVFDLNLILTRLTHLKRHLLSDLLPDKALNFEKKFLFKIVNYHKKSEI